MNIRQYFSARYPFLWLNTTEEERTIRAHRTQLKETTQVFSWDIAQGFREFQKNGDSNSWTWKLLEGDEPTTSPGEALSKVISFPENSIFYMKDYHKYFTDITVTRKALNVKDVLKSTARMICFMSCEGSSAIPPELKNDVTPYVPPMPTKQELAETVKRVASDNGIEELKNKDLDIFSNALIGLTEEGAENALSLCLVQNKKFDAKTLMREKSRLIEATVGLTYTEYSESFDDLAGNEIVIAYIKKAVPNPLSNAILLYGIPGCGKSHIAKAAGNYLGWPVIGINFGAINAKYQGETEGRLETVLTTIEAFGRCIVVADEVEKFIAGAEGGADSDAGAGSRKVGRLLSYFQDKKPGGSVWFMTCNSLQPFLETSGGAFIRRFDAIFFLDMPTGKERKEIAKIWSKKFSVNIPENFPLEGFTGADIAKLARQMKLLECGAEDARRYVIPTEQALGPRIDEIRRAAKATCIPAGAPEEKVTASTKRKLDL